MLTRRQALKSFALTSGALVISNALPAALRQAAAQGAAPSNPASAAPAAPTGPFTLPPLPYGFEPLGPHFDGQSMEIHHDKHHAAYVNNLNKAVAGRPELAAMKVDDLLRKLDTLPAEVKTAIRNQGGGHANHSQLWLSLKKGGASAPSGELAKAIDTSFGSFTAFQDKWTAAAMSVFGSGWAWLTWTRATGLAIQTAPNQDSPLSSGQVPLLGIDVWEHAYYLKYQNRRAEYVAAFAKVVDWEAISARARDAMKA